MSQFDSHLWFLEAIRYYRTLGLFASHHGSDEELGETIKSYWRGDWEEFLAATSDRPSADQLLLIADTKRIWWHDLEVVYRVTMFSTSGLVFREGNSRLNKFRKHGRVKTSLLM